MLLKFAIKDFLEEKKFINLSPITIDGYQRTLNEFNSFCVDKYSDIIHIVDITPSIIKSYLIYCKEERKNNPTSINTKLHNLKVFFNYLQEQEIITKEVNPIKKIKFLKEEVKISIFTDDQVKTMLKYFKQMKNRDKTFYAYRDHTIIVTLLSTGVRLGELVNLKWSDIDFMEETITVYGKKRELSSIPMTEKLKKELLDYMLFCQHKFKKLNEYVFITRENNKVTENAVKNMFKRLKKEMNFNTRLSAHTFRHYFAAKMIRAGCDVFTLQKILRHKNLQSTLVYVDLFGTALKEQNNKYNPINNIISF